MSDQENSLSIVSLGGNPNEEEIAALSAAIGLWLQGLSHGPNPQDIVDNSVDKLGVMLGILRSMQRSNQKMPLNVGYSSGRNTSMWSLSNRARSRK